MLLTGINVRPVLVVCSSELKESDIRPREIPSPKDSVFLASVRSHKKVFHRLAEFGKMLQEPGANFLEGVENDLRSTENWQNESHLQDHLDERMAVLSKFQVNSSESYIDSEFLTRSASVCWRSLGDSVFPRNLVRSGSLCLFDSEDSIVGL